MARNKERGAKDQEHEDKPDSLPGMQPPEESPTSFSSAEKAFEQLLERLSQAADKMERRPGRETKAILREENIRDSQVIDIDRDDCGLGVGILQSATDRTRKLIGVYTGSRAEGEGPNLRIVLTVKSAKAMREYLDGCLKELEP